MDSTWSPYKIKKINEIIFYSIQYVESAWTPHRPHTQVWVRFLQKKVHMDSMWTPQLRVESRRNLWGRVKSSKCLGIREIPLGFVLQLVRFFSLH